MADDVKTNDAMKGDVKETAPAGEQAQIRISLDDSNVQAAYSNFCRVTGTPEEVVIDFGLNPNPYAQQDQQVKVDTRLVLNLYTAKRLLAALQQTIMRHEQSFGAIELNVRRRLSPDAAGNQNQ